LDVAVWTTLSVGGVCGSKGPQTEKGFPAPLTSKNIAGMVFHMKTTLNIDKSVMARLKRESARTGRTMSELVETALRRLLQAKPGPSELPELPSFKSGGALVDIADREALYKAMEGR
jgi:hypothetical protein